MHRRDNRCAHIRALSTSCRLNSGRYSHGTDVVLVLETLSPPQPVLLTATAFRHIHRIHFFPSRSTLPHPALSSKHAKHEGRIDDNPIKVVGDNFLLQGVVSASQHAALCKAPVRLSIYVHLSVVKQHIFSVHVKLNIQGVRPRSAPRR